jgi:hypothetical protein
MFMQHQTQRHADKDRRENTPAAKTTCRCHHQCCQFYQRKQQII